MFITEEPVKAEVLEEAPFLLFLSKSTVLVKKAVLGISCSITSDLDLLSKPGYLFTQLPKSHGWEKGRMGKWKRNPNCCRLAQLPSEQMDWLTGPRAAEGRKKIVFSKEIRLPRSITYSEGPMRLHNNLLLCYRHGFPEEKTQTVRGLQGNYIYI